MREIRFEIRGKHLATEDTFAGYAGEHLATTLVVPLPAEWITVGGRYYFVFHRPNDPPDSGVITQPLAEKDGCISFALPQAVMAEGGVQLQLQLHSADGQVLCSAVGRMTVGRSLLPAKRAEDAYAGLFDTVLERFDAMEQEIDGVAKSVPKNIKDGAMYGSVYGVRANGESLGLYGVALGENTTASGQSSHAEGFETEASGYYSHAEGYKCKATNGSAHAEGGSTTASGSNSHAEGSGTYATGNKSHAEGWMARARGEASHAEGKGTAANGDYSYAAGEYTIASGKAQTALGQYNAEDADALFIVGNGTSTEDRKNAFVVRKDGSVLANGQPIGSGGGATPKEWVYINTITVEPDADGSLPTSVLFSTDSNGKTFKLTDIYISILAGATDGNTAAFAVNGKNEANRTYTLGGLFSVSLSATALRRTYFQYVYDPITQVGRIDVLPSIASTANYPNTNVSNGLNAVIPPYNYKTDSAPLPMCTVNIYLNGGTNKTWIEGSTFELYGVKA